MKEVRLGAKNRALLLAVEIIEARQAEVRRIHDEWCAKYGSNDIGAATERAAYMECELLARLIKERMSPAARAALSKATAASQEGKQ